MNKFKHLSVKILVVVFVFMAAFTFVGVNKTIAAAKINIHKKIAHKKIVHRRILKKKKVVKKAVIAKPKPAPLVLSNAASSPIVTNTVNQPAPTSTNTNVDCSSNFNQQFLCLLNQYRKSQGKANVVLAGDLSQVAQNYSQTMFSQNFFGHVAPDGSNFVTRCNLANVTCHAEIIAMGFTSAQHLFDLWKNSPPHNAIMLGDYKEFGLGTQNTYATGLFR